MSNAEGMTPAEAELLAKLARQFPTKFVHGNPSGGGSYVAHPVVRQRLLATFGLYDFTMVEILRGHVAGKAPNPGGNSARAKAGTPDLEGAVVGVVCRLTVPRADGRLVSIEDVGDCEDPYNWPHDGARLKDAMSDALKRCAMGMSVALHLWCKPGEYRLDAALAHLLEVEVPEGVDAETGEVAGEAEVEVEVPAEVAPPEAEPAELEPPAPDPVPEGMVATRDAKRQLMDALDAAGSDDPKAAAAAAWKASKIKAGPVPTEVLERIIGEALDVLFEALAEADATD